MPHKQVLELASERSVCAVQHAGSTFKCQEKISAHLIQFRDDKFEHRTFWAGKLAPFSSRADPIPQETKHLKARIEAHETLAIAIDGAMEAAGVRAAP